MALEAQPSPILRFGTFEVDLRAGELRKHGKRIKLQHQPFQVLVVLLQRPGGVVTRDELRAQIWPEDTFVDFDNGLNTSINKVREALGDSAESPQFIETLPRRGYRFIALVSSNNGIEGRAPSRAASSRWKIAFAVAVSLTIVGATAAGLYLRWVKHRLTEQDTVVLVDFLNTTGDSVFDDTLKQGLRAQLEQSPFLNLLSDQQIGEELRLMARQPSERLTPDLARDLCQRIGSKAVLTGSISSLGSHYVIGLSASNCRTGTELASEQSESADKEHVLAALGASATRIRKKLGESLASIEKFDVPFERVTTSSLDALQAYSLGLRYSNQDKDKESVLYFQRAIELDPNFASAYVKLSRADYRLGHQTLSDKNIEKAYALRDRVSRREQFQIATKYSGHKDDLEETASLAQLWAESYPRDAGARVMLTDSAMWMGDWQEAVRQGQLAVDLDQDNVTNYFNLAVSELALGRLDDARRTCDRSTARHIENRDIPTIRYWVALASHDTQQAAQRWKELEEFSKRNPQENDHFSGLQAIRELYFGRLSRAREIYKRIAKSAESAKSSGNEGFPILFYSWLALVNAEIGEQKLAQANLQLAARPHNMHRADISLALAAARIGEVSDAEKWVADYSLSSPASWWAQKRYLPVVRAAIAMKIGKPAEAVEYLRVVNGETEWWGNDPSSPDGLMTAYYRGQAYLQLHQGKEAASEFQRLLDHPGIVVDSYFGPLARVGLGRAYILQGDSARARAAYEDFFTIWKEADPDIPILMQARAEYAKLP
ncbi:MAG: tetratricopeptide repeat protein [Acidipila sp.]|nr:tetratricopeptide repeat protein [Acidipila sp.]